MGFFDGLRKDKNAAGTIKKQAQEEQVENIVEEEPIEETQPVDADPEVRDAEVISMREAEVVERAPRAQKSNEPEVIIRPLKSYAEKAPVTHVVGQTKIFAIINQKGGVGKSTTAVNLSAALGEMGRQVLLVDLDPQGNSSSGLGIEKSQVQHCIYDVLINDTPIEEVIIPDVCPGLDVVPATINLAGAEVELVTEMARENRLKDALGRLRGRYDYIMVDCPPSLALLTVNALVAADKLLVPIQCEFYALEGVTKLLDSMKLVKSRLNPTLDIFGVLMTMHDSRTILSKQVEEETRKFFGRAVFDVVIPRSVKLSEAPSFGQPITQYDPTGKGALAYTALAKEVIARG